MLAALGIAAGCKQRDAADPTPRNTVADSASAVAEVPQPTPLLDRAGLLDAIGTAANAFAAGSDDRKVQANLKGRRFAVRMPFACNGPVDEKSTAPLRMTTRAGSRGFEIRAVPDLDAAGAEIDQAGGDNPAAIQSVEGFWFRYPWLLAEQCPAPRAPGVADRNPSVTLGPDASVEQAAAQEMERSAGIAQFFTSEDSRLLHRSGRDYRKVVALPKGSAPPKGLFLLLEGRLRAWPDGKVVRCRDPGKGKRPSCIAAATIDRVAVERIDDRSILAEWTTG